MKVVKVSLVIMVLALLTIDLSGMAYAFHSGGVGECGGCHSMHSPKSGGSFLLVGTDQSSTCMTCHLRSGDTGPTSYHVVTADADMPGGTAPLQRTPGGDFGWLKKSYTFTIRGTTNIEPGQSHGHNVVAADFDYIADPDKPTAPGGTFPSNQLACNSCHDPHGKYRILRNWSIVTTGAPIIGSGSYNNSPIPKPGQAVGVYRLLAGSGYKTEAAGFIPFPGVPVAVAPSTYNQSEATRQVRVAYGHSPTRSGRTSWDEWCATCHRQMHSRGNYVHPVDESLGSTHAKIYNKYVNSGNTAGGNPATAYLSLVPFIEIADYPTLRAHANSNGTYLGGPRLRDQVSCLSCHRAHASGWEYALRWSMEGEFITYADTNGAAVWPGTDTTPTKPELARGRTSAETRAAYYDRDVMVFGAYQRVLCNKCHAKD